MTALLSTLFLVAGAALCLIASVGVLRLPDFFMRMHAATKAGVAGCGLLLIGVAFAHPSPGMWIKVAIAIIFLLLTTPIAGHLLARAGYVAGVPLWGGTREDQLSGELPRGDFERPAMARRRNSVAIKRVVLGLAHGNGMDAAVAHAIALARTHKAEIVGLAIIDTKTLNNVGPVPIGGNYYAAQMRASRIGRARNAVAETVHAFEMAVKEAGLRFSVSVEEGDPAPLLRAHFGEGVAMVMPRRAWFDHGVADRTISPMSRLARYRLGTVEHEADDDAPLIVLG